MEKNLKKCAIIGVMTMVFWCVSLIIGTIVKNRSNSSREARVEIAQSWGGKQTVLGPIICVPTYYVEQNDTKPKTCTFFLPDQLELTADLKSETLHRGIFDASVYRTHVEGKGTFRLKELLQADSEDSLVETKRLDWSKAQIIVGIDDKSKLDKYITISFGGHDIELNKNFYDYDIREQHCIVNNYYDVNCRVADLTDLIEQEEIAYSFNFEVRGTEKFAVSPIGKNNVITMRGNSQDPSFGGITLPTTREITDEGFTATWSMSSLSRPFSEQVHETDLALDFEDVSTQLMIPGGQYTQTDRALKYAFMVLLLSLMAIYIAEMNSDEKISLLNYVLIGAALVLFYLLLLSLAEWIGFTWAYVVSSVMIVGLITLYLNGVMCDSLAAKGAGVFLALVYVFIYILLSIDTLALLVGSLGLFVVLGVAMYLSQELGE